MASGCEPPVLGGKIAVPTIDGPEFVITIPAGTRVGQALRIQGYGMPKVSPVAGEAEQGDMFVVVDVIVPATLTDWERELLEEFAACQGCDLDNNNYADVADASDLNV